MNTHVKLNPVKSSNIKAHGYDAHGKVLSVQFNSGKVYHYHDVPQEAADAFAKAESLGAHFAKHIRGAFKYTEMVPA